MMLASSERLCTHWSLGEPYCGLTSSVCRSWQLADIILSALSLMAWVNAAQSLFRLIPLPTQFWAPAHNCHYEHTHTHIRHCRASNLEKMVAKCHARLTDRQTGKICGERKKSLK